MQRKGVIRDVRGKKKRELKGKKKVGQKRSKHV